MEEDVKMNKYVRRHKEVTAVMIADIEYYYDASTGNLKDGNIILQNGSDKIPISLSYINSQNPDIGGYYAVDNDGNQLFIPRQEFKKDYIAVVETPYFSFCDALKALTAGKKVARNSWNNGNVLLIMKNPDQIGHNATSVPYLELEFYSNGDNVPYITWPWNPSIKDMLAKDWCIIK